MSRRRRLVELRLRRLSDDRIRSSWEDSVDLDDADEVHELLVAAVVAETGRFDKNDLPLFQMEARHNGSWRTFRAGKK